MISISQIVQQSRIFLLCHSSGSLAWWADLLLSIHYSVFQHIPNPIAWDELNVWSNLIRYHWLCLKQYPLTHCLMLWHIQVSMRVHRYFNQPKELLVHLYGLEINAQVLYTYLLTIMLISKLLGGQNLSHYALSGFTHNLLLCIYVFNGDHALRQGYLMLIAITFYLSYRFRRDHSVWHALKSLLTTIMNDFHSQREHLQQHPHHFRHMLMQAPAYLLPKICLLTLNLYEASNLIQLTIRIDRHNVMHWYGASYIKKIRNDIRNRCHAAFYHSRRIHANDIKHMAMIYAVNSIKQRPHILRLNDPILESNLVRSLQQQSQEYLRAQDVACYSNASLTLVKHYALSSEIHRLIRSYLDINSSSKLNITAKSLFMQPNNNGLSVGRTQGTTL